MGAVHEGVLDRRHLVRLGFVLDFFRRFLSSSVPSGGVHTKCTNAPNNVVHWSGRISSQEALFSISLTSSLFDLFEQI